MNGVPSARNGRPMWGFMVAGQRDIGGRKYMEDYMVIQKEASKTDRGTEPAYHQVFLAVLDGHGGKEAAKYARENLWGSIKAHDYFKNGDPVKVAQSIASGFVKTHEDMWSVRGS